jgi:hypothetical protein
MIFSFLNKLVTKLINDFTYNSIESVGSKK